MPQLTYQDQSSLPGFEGGLYDTGPQDMLSRSPGGNVAQIDTITLSGTPGNVETYTVTLNGVPVSFVTDASGTLQELYDGLLAALLAESFNVPSIVGITGNGTTVISVTATNGGVPFTLVETLDSTGNLVLATATANVSGNPIPFGRGVVRSASGDDLAVLPSATGFVFEGISVNRAKGRIKDNSVSPPITGDAEYKEDESFPVLRKGRIWVIPEDAVTPASDVYLRHTANGVTFVPGRWRTDADTAKGDQITGARWLTTASAGQLAVLEINLP